LHAGQMPVPLQAGQRGSGEFNATLIPVPSHFWHFPLPRRNSLSPVQ